MPRGICRIRQSDVTKALKAMRDAGWPSGRLELEPGGKLVVVVESSPGAEISAPAASDKNEFGE